jgi:hypothetical protein
LKKAVNERAIYGTAEQLAKKPRKADSSLRSE